MNPQRQSALPSGQWYPPNHTELLNFVAAKHAHGACAALDWDNTSCRGDVGDTVFRYQLAHGILRLTPDALAALFSELDEAHDALIGRLKEEVLAAWRVICSDDAVMPALLAAQQRFCVAGLLLYETSTQAHCAEKTVATSYGLLAQLWSGFEDDEIEHHARLALAWGRALGTAPVTWACGADALGPAREVCFNPTIGAEANMRALYRALKDASVEPYVITASFEPLVRAAAGHFDVPVEKQHIIGLRLAHKGAAEAAAPLCPNHPLTYRKGKVEAIARYLPSAPLLVAGDALTDYEMLTLHQDLKLRLIIDRRSTRPEMMALYDEALKRSPQRRDAIFTAKKPVTLLQGRDPLTLAFVPQQRSA